MFKCKRNKEITVKPVKCKKNSKNKDIELTPHFEKQ